MTVITCKRKRMGPRTLPWGTSLVTCIDSDELPLILTRWVLFDRKSFIQAWMFPLIPYPHSFFNNRLCDTRSNALLKSRYMTSTSSPLCRAVVTSSRNSNNWIMQDLPARKPCCDLVKRLLAIMCWTISSQISCPKRFPCTAVTLCYILKLMLWKMKGAIEMFVLYGISAIFTEMTTI